MSEYQAAVQGEVQKRMEAAVGDLADLYASGVGGQDVSVDGPTGAAYKAAAAEMRKNQPKRSKGPTAAEIAEEVKKERTVAKAAEEDEELEDNELEKLREARLKQLQAQKAERIENMGKGHGQYREITQDEFLPEVTSSKLVVCHFYHRDFERCKIMDMHLAKLAPKHVETKFIKIDGEKSPFFVEKLMIRTMPTLVCFDDGIARDKVLGFEGLSDTMSEGKEDQWPTVYLAKLLADKFMISAANIVDEDELLKKQQDRMEQMRLAYIAGSVQFDSDEDFDDLDI